MSCTYRKRISQNQLNWCRVCFIIFNPAHFSMGARTARVGRGSWVKASACSMLACGRGACYPSLRAYAIFSLLWCQHPGWDGATLQGLVLTAHQSVAAITPPLHLALLRFAIYLRPRPQQVCTSTSALCSLISRCWTTTFVVALLAST
jgi:hypothetical protein